jgi:hypothetical protein
VGDEHANKQFKCKSCGGAMRVPAALSPVIHQDPSPEESVETTRCPYCRERIIVGAKVCKHCTRTLDVTLRAAEEAQRAAEEARRAADRANSRGGNAINNVVNIDNGRDRGRRRRYRDDDDYYYNREPPKSVGVAILLSFLFGPLGMFYSTVPGGLVMLFVSPIVILVTFGFGIFVTHPICIIWAAVAASNHNANVYARRS